MGQPWVAKEVHLDFSSFNLSGGAQCGRCWSVIAYVVSLYYSPNSSWTPCTIANAALDRTDCCDYPTACDVFCDLDIALTATGNLASMVTGRLEKDEIVAELDEGRPVCVRVDYIMHPQDPAVRHFALIYGYFEAAGPEDNYFTIWDPHLGISSQPVLPFCAYGDYQGSGFDSYSHTYFTQAPPP
jgi:hypothetical protein